MITSAILKQICPSLNEARAELSSAELIKCFTKYGIVNINSQHHFIAQVCHESGEFSIKSENMNYSRPALLMANWPKHFPSLDFAQQYCHNPEKLANYIYGVTSIAKDLGNRKPSDGYEFRGAGYLQLTGFDSAERYRIYAKLDTAEHAADLLRSDDHYAMDAAGWEFIVSKNLLQISLQDTPEAFLTITKRINGGTIGLESRQLYYNKCKQYLK